MLWSKLAASYSSVTLVSDSGLSDKLRCEEGSEAGVEILGCDVKASYSSMPGLGSAFGFSGECLRPLWRQTGCSHLLKLVGRGSSFTPFSVSHLSQSRWVWVWGKDENRTYFSCFSSWSCCSVNFSPCLGSNLHFFSPWRWLSFIFVK